MKACFGYCHYANYSQIYLSALDISCFFLGLGCGFFLCISSWTVHSKTLPEAEYALPLLHVLMMNILSYLTRKLRKIINFVSTAYVQAKGK